MSEPSANKPAFPTAAPAQSGNSGAEIANDAIVKGDITTSGILEVHGLLDGTAKAKHIIVYPQGKIVGKIISESADIRGIVQGEAKIIQHLSIASSGSINGQIEYGQISMAQGAELSADLKNIPPTLAGDMKIEVGAGQSVTITTQDIKAVDPDDDAKDLVFDITQPVGGFVARKNAPQNSVSNFTQAELEYSQIIFVHDGHSGTGSFMAQVKDAGGATSGAPEKVTIEIR